MMLNDQAICALMQGGLLTIDPTPATNAFQPASVDLTLGTSFVNIGPHGPMTQDTVLPGEEVWITPQECVLACTAETVKLPNDIVARVEGKSTWARYFLMVHSTAGFIDPGFHGQITLELVNLSPVPLRLTVGEPIAQVTFQVLNAPAQRPYGSPGLGSRYQHQVGATLPRDEATAPGV